MLQRLTRRAWSTFAAAVLTATSGSQMIGMFIGQAYRRVSELQIVLDGDPMQMEFVEQQVKQSFDRGGGLRLTEMIASSIGASEHETRCVQTRQEYAVPLRSGTERQIEADRGAGFASDVSIIFFRPKTPAANKTEYVPGLDNDLRQHGFSENVLPWLVSKVSRTVALAPRLIKRTLSSNATA